MFTFIRFGVFVVLLVREPLCEATPNLEAKIQIKYYRH